MANVRPHVLTSGVEQTRTLALPEVLAAERDGKLDQLAATLAMDVFSLGLLLHKVYTLPSRRMLLLWLWLASFKSLVLKVQTVCATHFSRVS